jgi:hypothetical protein
MPRGWHPLRFFVREDGRLHPTILFWLFLLPGLTVAVAGCYTVLNRRAEQQTAAAALTKTPTPAATETPAPTAIPTARPPTIEPTATAYVYDDPSGWEFVEKTDPTGKKYMDLQDWQKEQVWHAFGEFYTLYNRSDKGLTPYKVIEPYISGTFVSFVRGDYQTAERDGKYLYLEPPLEELDRGMVLSSSSSGSIVVKVMLTSSKGFPAQYRDNLTGAVLEDGKWLPYTTWSFLLTFKDHQWVVEGESHEMYQQ